MADLAVWQRTIVDEEGQVIPFAEVAVRRADTGSLVSIYRDRDGTQAAPNPIQADANGFVRFFAPGGAYQVEAYGAGSSLTWQFVAVGRLAEHDAVGAAQISDSAAERASIRDKLEVASDAELHQAVGEAEAARDAAESARDAATVNARIYPDTTAGLSDTSDGDYFSVPSEDDDEYLILYRNDDGSAVEVRRYPASGAVESLHPLSLTSDLLYIGSEPIEPTHINARGEVVQGISRVTGMPLIGGSSPPDVDPDAVVVRAHPGEFWIHFPQLTGTYIRWGFIHRERPAYDAEVWQVYTVTEVAGTSPADTVLSTIVDTGQAEIALRRAVDGSSFNIGGWAHGRDMMMADPVMLVDGVERPINGTGLFTCRSLEFCQASQMLDPDDLSNFAKRYTLWRFAKGELFLSNTLVIEKEIHFTIMYLSMLSVLRGGGDITHSLIRAPRWFPLEDASGEYSDAGDQSHYLKVWGDRYGAEGEMLEGWDRPNRRSWASSGIDRNKLYFDFTGDYTPEVGEVIRGDSRLRVTAFGV